MINTALLTSAGRSAIATIGVCGDGAVELVSAFVRFHGGQSLYAAPRGRILLGRWCGADRHDIPNEQPAEEVVVHVQSERRVEIHCHGGSAASTAILNSLQRAHCQQVDWRCFLAENEADQWKTDALAALVLARTEKAAAILLDQYRGALFYAWQEIEKLLAAGKRPQAKQQLIELKKRGRVGVRLASGFRVVLCGRPNVGKSSLMNALVGFSRAIVFDRPGTTRDVLSFSTAFDGWPVELIDTAGMRQSRDPLENQGAQRARRETDTADVVIQVVDASAPWTRPDVEVRECVSPNLIVFNKSDLLGEDFTMDTSGATPHLLASARTGAGVQHLIDHTASLLVPHRPLPQAATPFTKEHLAAIERALQSLETQI